MKLEVVPLIIGALVALLGVGIILDGWLDDGTIRRTERRRSQRMPRNRTGEVIIGVGVLGMAGSLVGRDTWRYGTVAVIVGVVCLGLGIAMNAHHIRQLMTSRGASRRRDSADQPPPEPEQPTRIP